MTKFLLHCSATRNFKRVKTQNSGTSSYFIYTGEGLKDITYYKLQLPTWISTPPAFASSPEKVALLSAFYQNTYLISSV